MVETSEVPEISAVKLDKPAKKSVQHEKAKVPVDSNLVNRAFDMSANESNEVNISTLGLNLRKLDPSFDSRTYGYKTLTSLFANLRGFELVDNIINGRNHPVLKRKSQARSS